MRWVALFSSLALLSGCTVTTERNGDPFYLRAAAEGTHFEVGATTSLEVAKTLGPPDEVLTRGEELWFVYRFRDRRSSQLVLSYYLNWIQRHSVHEIDSELIVAFDRRDRFLYMGVSGLPREGGFIRHFD